MNPQKISNLPARHAAENEQPEVRLLHPLWRAFIDYCLELRHGEIEILRIQDGVPILAEVVRKKIKFSS